ncbi:MAG: type II secretion system protein [Patescibacteria group bacterium]
MKRGFSLIELLVVISIIAVITGVSLTNFLGARQRARDAKRKSDLVQLAQSLRLYYNDYNKYPVSDSSVYIAGCGTSGTTRCPTGCTSGEFAAGGSDGCAVVYMRGLPKEYTYNRHPNKPTDRDDFLLSVTLENASDEDSTTSQTRCGISPVAAKQYVLCAD